MSAKEIPDLRTLLGRGRGGGLRARGRGKGSPGPSRETNDTRTRDIAIQSTDQDAAGSRVSCVELGYLHDPYAKVFSTQPATRRLPLLNRGTYVRTSAVDLLIDGFLSSFPDRPKQIISLGAGTDTRYFRLLDRYPNSSLIYHEIDFPTNTATKLQALRRNPPLYNRLIAHSPPQPVGPAATYMSKYYNLTPMDLRDLARPEKHSIASLPNLDPSVPTLILSEMCLIYLQASTASAILSTFLQEYIPAPTPVSIVLYEPILPNDAFGRTMTSNLATRNIHLPTLSAYPELGDQRARLKTNGFVDGAKAVDTAWIWRQWVPEEEKERVAGLEMLDELEELDLLLRHYCIAWGWRDDGGDGVFTKAWSGIGEQ